MDNIHTISAINLRTYIHMHNLDISEQLIQILMDNANRNLNRNINEPVPLPQPEEEIIEEENINRVISYFTNNHTFENMDMNISDIIIDIINNNREFFNTISNETCNNLVSEATHVGIYSHYIGIIRREFENDLENHNYRNNTLNNTNDNIRTQLNIIQNRLIMVEHGYNNILLINQRIQNENNNLRARR
mgnify:CR=1 FL=1